jgi:nitrogen fixation protein NifU and related proteins
VSDLRELYQQIILDHNRNPRNFRALPDANRTAEGHNPLCGDRIKLYLVVEGDVIKSVGFQGSGCAISQASASLMTAAVSGKTTGEADTLFHQFHDMVAGGPNSPADTKSLGKLAAFAGVREFPARVKCANLAWHTLHAALADESNASTE